MKFFPKTHFLVALATTAMPVSMTCGADFYDGMRVFDAKGYPAAFKETLRK